MPEQPRYVLTLQPVPGHPGEPAQRLRRALKYLLRACGLRCLKAEELPPKEGPTDATPPPAPGA